MSGSGLAVQVGESYLVDKMKMWIMTLFGLCILLIISTVNVSSKTIQVNERLNITYNKHYIDWGITHFDIYFNVSLNKTKTISDESNWTTIIEKLYNKGLFETDEVECVFLKKEVDTYINRTYYFNFSPHNYSLIGNSHLPCFLGEEFNKYKKNVSMEWSGGEYENGYYTFCFDEFDVGSETIWYNVTDTIVGEYFDFNPAGKTIQQDKWYDVMLHCTKDFVFGENNYDINPKLFGVKLEMSIWEDTWWFRKNITIPASLIQEDLIDFPLLINITSDSNLAAGAQSDGDDIVFTNEQGGKLSHGIENWTSSRGDLIAWVKANLSSTSNTTIYMYYGNAEVSSQQDSTNIWDDRYVLVYHMNDTAYKDLSGNGNDVSTDGVSSLGKQGTIGSGQDFDGTDYLYVSDSPTLRIQNNLTISYWVEMDDKTTVVLLSKRYAAPVYNSYLNQVGSDSKLGFYLRDSTSAKGIFSPNALNTGQWYHFVSTFDGTDMKMYIDGMLVSNSSEFAGQTIIYDSTILDIGGLSGWYSNGRMDEIRISNISRTDAWINASYKNQRFPGDFYFVNDQESFLEYPYKIVDNSSTLATAYNQNENIVKDHLGHIHVVYRNGSDNLWYAKSIDEGITWTQKYLEGGTGVSSTGIVINSTGGLFVYADVGNDINATVSSDGGETWSDFFTIASIASKNMYNPSCVTDSDDIIHCAIIQTTDDYAYYVNSTQWNTEVEVNTNAADDSDACDIEVDTSNCVYITCFGTDQGDIDIWSPCLNGWGDGNRVQIDAGPAGSAITMASGNDGKLYATWVDSGVDLWFASSNDGGSTWSASEIKTGTYYSPEIAVSESNDLFILYSDGVNNVSGAYSSDGGDTWQYNFGAQGLNSFFGFAATRYPTYNRVRDRLDIFGTNSTAAQVIYYNESITYGISDTTSPTFNRLVTAGNPSQDSFGKGPPGADVNESYYRNGTRQTENWIYIQANISDDYYVDNVILSFKDSVGWTNYTMNYDAGNFYYYNVTDLPEYCCYTFDIYANDLINTYNIYNWTYHDWVVTWGDREEYRKYVGLNYTASEFSYTQFYFFNASYNIHRWAKRELGFEQPLDGTNEDTGVLKEDHPTEDYIRSCVRFLGFPISEPVTLNETTINNTYVHVWWHTDSPDLNNSLFVTKVRSQSNPGDDNPYTNINVTNTTSKSNISLSYFNDTKYYLAAEFKDFKDESDYYINVTSNDINLIYFGIQNNYSFPSIISTANYSSFIIFNLPDNATLAASDTDSDGLSDKDELFTYYTDPNDSDTDNGGESDYSEVISGSDPLISNDDGEEITDETAPTGNITTITNNSIYNSTKLLVGSQWNETCIVLNFTINNIQNHTATDVAVMTNYTYTMDIGNGTYNISSTCLDIADNLGISPYFNFSIKNITGITAADTTPPAVISREPANNTNTFDSFIQFNITLTEVGGSSEGVIQLWTNASESGGYCDEPTGVECPFYTELGQETCEGVGCTWYETTGWDMEQASIWTDGVKFSFNSTDYGTLTNIIWGVYYNDSLGNYNWTQNWTINLNQGDTCSCPASGDWLIDCSDNCIISTECDMQGNDVHTYGTGDWILASKIFNFGTIYNRCDIYCNQPGGNCFE